MVGAAKPFQNATRLPDPGGTGYNAIAALGGRECVAVLERQGCDDTIAVQRGGVGIFSPIHLAD